MSRMLRTRPTNESSNAQKNQQGNNETNDGDEDSSRKRIWLHFVGNNPDWGEMRDQHIRAIYGQPLRKTMESYAKRVGLNFYHIRFIFDGHRLHPDQTPREYLLEDDDLIDVVQDQHGGMMK